MKVSVHLAACLIITITSPLFAGNAHAETLCVLKNGLIKVVSAQRCPLNSKPLSIPIKGPKGDKGESGATGPQGAPGERGDVGAVGIQGPQGEKGDAGEVGAQGPQGDTGDTGDVGPQGEKGDTGDAGPQGPQGDAGPQGEAGPKGDPGTATNFTTDVLMTCKHYSFKSTLKGAGSTTDKSGRTTRKVTARCGANQWMVGHAESPQTATANTQVVSSLTMRDIVTQPTSNASDFTTATDGSAAIPSGVAVEFSDTAGTNALSTRLICCTLDVNSPEGTPTIE